MRHINSAAVLGVVLTAPLHAGNEPPPPFFDRDATHEITLPASTTDLTVADLNADGADDILLASQGDIIIRWGGPFADTELPILLDGDDYTAPVICDEDHDGLLDVFVCSPTMSQVHLQQDDGTFYYLSRAYPQAHAADFGNFDSDDRLDYVTFFDFYGPADMMFVRTMDADGFYQYSFYLIHAHINEIQAADFNGDGFDDIAIVGAVFLGGYENATFGVMLNDGTGAFAEPQWWISSYIGFWMTIHDIDNDGDLDAAVSAYKNCCTSDGIRVDFHMNDGNAQFVVERPYPQLWPHPIPSGQDLADIDGDGSPDLVAAHTDEIYVLHGTTPGMFEPWQEFYDPSSRVFEYPSVADFNGDGTLDLAYLNRDWAFEIDPNTYLTIVPGTCIHTCPGDANLSGAVDVFDLIELLTNWGQCTDCAYDLTGDGAIDVLDLAELFNRWGDCD